MALEDINANAKSEEFEFMLTDKFPSKPRERNPLVSEDDLYLGKPDVLNQYYSKIQALLYIDPADFSKGYNSNVLSDPKFGNLDSVFNRLIQKAEDEQLPGAKFWRKKYEDLQEELNLVMVNSVEVERTKRENTNRRINSRPAPFSKLFLKGGYRFK